MSYEAWGEPDDSPFDAAAEAGWINPEDTSKAIIDVMNERDRQWNERGFTPELDDGYQDFELTKAAVSYAQRAAMSDGFRKQEEERDLVPHPWPWSRHSWKPKDRRSDLVRAAALIVAEIERLDRAEKRAQQQGERE